MRLSIKVRISLFFVGWFFVIVAFLLIKSFRDTILIKKLCNARVRDEMSKNKHTTTRIILIFNYRYRDPCSASINEDDLHTTKLIGDGNKKVSTERR